MTDVGKPSDLVTFRDLVAATGYSERHARRFDLPTADAQFGLTQAWKRSTLVAWLRDNGMADAADRLRDA